MLIARSYLRSTKASLLSTMAHSLLSCHGYSSCFPLDSSLFFQRISTKFLLIPVNFVVLDRTQDWRRLGKWCATPEGCPANIQITLSVTYHTLCAGFILLFFPLQPWLSLLLHLILTSFLFLFASVLFSFLSCPSPFLDLQCSPPSLCQLSPHFS